MNQTTNKTEVQRPRAGSKVIQFQVVDRMLYILLDDGTLWKRSSVLDAAEELRAPWHKLVTIEPEPESQG